MQVHRSLDAARGALRGCAVAIGNFDGVHLGHRRLFELARLQAMPRGAPAVALTFDPHPVRVLRPAFAPPLLTPLPRKLELLGTCGLAAVVVQPFDVAYAASSAEEFVARDLCGRLGAADVVVGPDFTAGRDRARVDRLRTLLAASGIALTVADPVTVDGLVVSSTKIREFLLEGSVDGAALLLGRPHDVDGTVERGGGRGRGFGFATANIRGEGMLPANGVYAVRGALAGGARYGGVCNVGVKPTVQRAGPVTAEAHLFDFDGRDLYGERLRLAFVARLRDERRFPSVDALRAQIAEDAAQARAVLADPAPM
jgi:riboflavin kinase / FMN adenylyltransferase